MSAETPAAGLAPNENPKPEHRARDSGGQKTATHTPPLKSNAE
jgi:hypothetical protein